MPIRLAQSDEELALCHEVMRQLRPQLEPDRFMIQVRRQSAEGYRLAMVVEQDRVLAVAGYRISENLAWGRLLYVDDLVSDESSRSSGHGFQLLEWIRRHAIAEGCNELHLDSGVQRFGAHRFYLRFGMDITSHHFALRLDEQQTPGDASNSSAPLDGASLRS